ncbi:Uu.00g008760.m01.CDS01 [Anthostomella pinea]|uniref:Uu.00g008760.m01.CDS01 n=1 Tax=Anthostomella pinea TaxID=933095 RepID=A0AAI8VX80_9PEZI|nr:Uu.00g008760.m01.CDS01 [Anthostomella pinea]
MDRNSRAIYTSLDMETIGRVFNDIKARYNGRLEKKNAAGIVAEIRQGLGAEIGVPEWQPLWHSFSSCDTVSDQKKTPCAERFPNAANNLRPKLTPATAMFAVEGHARLNLVCHSQASDLTGSES